MPRGGARPNAGRKANTGMFGEKTVVRRIPVSLVGSIDQIIHSMKAKAAVEEKINSNHIVSSPAVNQWGYVTHSSLNLPFFESRVAAGFPSPADDHVEASLDLNQHLIKHPAATFFVRVSGESMINAGINNNDILIVDRSLEPRHGNIIVAALNGELTVKRLYLKGNKVSLQPENPDYPAIEVSKDIEFVIFGVVTSSVHQYK